MENTNISRHTVSFGLSLALASVVNALLVIAKEKNPAVMAGLQRLTGHHWISHSAIVLSLFVLCGLILAQLRGGQGIKLTATQLLVAVVSGVCAGALIIVGFYLVGDA